MSMIAYKIGIKKPSFYKHFSSKDEIVECSKFRIPYEVRFKTLILLLNPSVGILDCLYPIVMNSFRD